MSEKIIIMTIYGKGNKADAVSFRAFNSAKAAHLYVTATQRKDADAWIRCEFAEKWKKYPMRREVPLDFAEEILKLYDREMQFLLMEISSEDLCKAIKGMASEVQDKFFRNMTKSAFMMINKEMESLGAIKESVQVKAREKILNLIQMLAGEGRIICKAEAVEINDQCNAIYSR